MTVPVVGVRFKRMGKVYYFDPMGIGMKMGDQVIVETSRGVECGEVAYGPAEVPQDRIVPPLKPVLRVATEQDLKAVAANEAREREAFEIGQERILKHKLEMKLVDVELTFDASRMVFYFTANGRVDFRELVKDLTTALHSRVELRQIGVRDEAKMLGGLGACGRSICCRQFLPDFQPVSIKMAKDQNLSLNPTKISGLCGRLMCCLQYEHETYESMRRTMPRLGKEVKTPDGVGTVVEVNVLTEHVRVKVQLPDHTHDVRSYPAAQVVTLRRAPDAREQRAGDNPPDAVRDAQDYVDE